MKFQQDTLKVFEYLQELKERLKLEDMISGDENIEQKELVIFNVADWAVEELRQLCQNTAQTFGNEEILFNDIKQTGCLLIPKIY